MPGKPDKQMDFEFNLILEEILITYDPKRDQTVVEVISKLEKDSSGKTMSIRLVSSGDRCEEIKRKFLADPQLRLADRPVIPGGLGHA